MTKPNDLSGNNTFNNVTDLSNNDLSNNDLSNNDLSNNDLFSDLVNIYKPLYDESNINIELIDK